MSAAARGEAMNRAGRFRVAHLTTVDLSLQFLVRPQLIAVNDAGGQAIGVSAPGPWVEGLEDQGIEHIALTSSTRGMNPVADIRAALQLWRILRREQFTVLHTHNPKPGLYGRVLGRLAGVPLVVNTMHGLYATRDDRWLKRWIVYSAEAFAARFSDAELHQNTEDLDFCRRRRILPRGKGSLLGNGVDLERFDPAAVDPGARARIRAELGAHDGDIVVGAVGRLVAEKGFPELFEAAARMGDRYVFAAIGPDDPEKSDALPPEMIDAARRAGMRFLGMRSDIVDLYSAMDIFVLPSHREGFPRAAMEATAMGLPVIATDIRGCRQVVDNDVTGVLVPVRDPDTLRAAIARLGEEPGLREAMGGAGRRRAIEHFDERQVVRRVMDAYRSGLVAKGLGHLLPAGMVGDDPPLSTRPAVRADAPALADLHLSHMTDAFLPALGKRFMRILYRALIDWPDATVFVAEDGGGRVGYAAGVLDVGSFYRHFLRRHGLTAGLAALHRLVRPKILRAAWETLRYGRRPESGVPAELLAMVVAPRARRQGVAIRLGQQIIDGLSSQGASAIRVVVGAGNAAAAAAYRRMGFSDAGKTEVHNSEPSEVLVWRR